MGLSLRDQLLQAGLLTHQQAKKAGKEQHQQRRDQPKKPQGPDPKALAEQRARDEKAARDRELNRQQQEKADAKARRAEVKQLIGQHKVARVEGEELYNFVDGKKIRRLAMDRALRDRLVGGTLVIVRNDGRYEIVPAEIAERIRARDERAIVAPSTAADAAPAAKDESDPYKDFVVPDDLMW